MSAITITLHPMLATTLRNVLRKRAAELDSYLRREGEALDALDYDLTREVRRQVRECLAIIEAALPAERGRA